jgi:hypothetical protein
MFPTYKDYSPDFKLDKDDIIGIQVICFLIKIILNPSKHFEIWGISWILFCHQIASLRNKREF